MVAIRRDPIPLIYSFRSRLSEVWAPCPWSIFALQLKMLVLGQCKLGCKRQNLPIQMLRWLGIQDTPGTRADSASQISGELLPLFQFQIIDRLIFLDVQFLCIIYSVCLYALYIVYVYVHSKSYVSTNFKNGKHKEQYVKTLKRYNVKHRQLALNLGKPIYSFIHLYVGNSGLMPLRHLLVTRQGNMPILSGTMRPWWAQWSVTE